MILSNKVILVISPQEWGKMLLSKHHYAIELAKAGNTVYFLNPPDQRGELRFNSILIEKSGLHDNLFLIRHRLYFPFFLKFKALPVFYALMKPHINNILKKIGKKVDIVWSFDIGNLFPFRLFPKQLFKVFHPVDEPLRQEAIAAAKGANIVFSVTREILDKYKGYDVPREFINHGVSESFLASVKNGQYITGQPIKVGYSGNMLRADIDRPVLLSIVRDNPMVEFHFFGSYQVKGNNMGGNEDNSTLEFISSLQQLPHVKLHGVLGQQQLAAAFGEMDAFLVCYDIQKDQSKGTNYHKLMEFLATGRVVISNNITTYSNQPVLIQMTTDRDHNRVLPELFKSVVNNLGQYNDVESQKARKDFAAANTYPQQLTRIGNMLAPYLEKL